MITVVPRAFEKDSVTDPISDMTGSDDHLHDDALKRLDFPADGHAVVRPSNCITHVCEVGFAAQDDDGRLANWYLERLRKMCL